MRHLVRIFYYFGFMLLAVACSPMYSPGDNIPFVDFMEGLTYKEREVVLMDTITPPDNPMNEVPYVPGTHTFRGVLELKYFNGELYCAVRALKNEYYLADNGASYLFRLDNPMLSDCVVGDTIVVTAEPMKLRDDFSLATYYIQPNK